MSNYYDEGYKFNMWLNKKAVQIKAGANITRESILYEAGMAFRLGKKAMNERIDLMINIEGFEEDGIGDISAKKG